MLLIYNFTCSVSAYLYIISIKLKLKVRVCIKERSEDRKPLDDVNFPFGDEQPDTNVLACAVFSAACFCV